MAVYTDSGLVCGCDHQHPNIATATACVSQPGGYVVAIRRGEMEPLKEAEEAEFEKLMYGRTEAAGEEPDFGLLVRGEVESNG